MDLRNMVRSKVNNTADKNRQEISKDNLEKLIVKRMQTIMIGALASVEQHFGFLWGKDDVTKQKTEEEREIESIFQKIRAEILDKSNNQIRSIKEDLQLYDVSLIKKFINLPISK
jgi:transcription termination factor Rho